MNDSASEPGSVFDVARSWDARADLYLQLFRHEWDSKPFDRAVLAEFAGRVGGGGRVCDVGCGPCGKVTAMLVERGLDVLGIDLSPRCIELARREEPECQFEVRDQQDVGRAVQGGLLDGLVSYYSLHDRPKRELPSTLAAWGEAIRLGGQLLIVAKEGTSDGVVGDPLGTDHRVYWAEFTAQELCRAAEAAAFQVDDVTVREAYADEISTRRIYLSATRLARA
ncbi:class I SAM-dependent methyltransferase [Streptomyces sp. NPDC057287]|uniref:class I SAM-dependent methyltransferase n=1 Tax=Streptomyces sp. NPDC057287 TaxID=3346086 RepID=UPI0036418173